MKWIEVKIKTSHEAVEIVSNILHESGAGGVVIEDPQDLMVFQRKKENWDFIDESLLNWKDETVFIKAYLSESADLLDKIQLIKERVDLITANNVEIATGEVTISEVNEEDWASAWKKYYKPTKIGKKIVIKPTWEEYYREAGQHIIELDPGMAFGTGTHETTQLCIGFLEEYIKENSTTIDIGTGTGILGIVAAKLGSKKVIGVDIDSVAVKVAKENVRLNKVEQQMEIREGNLFDVVKEKGDIVVANIIADIIIELSKNIDKFLKKDGIFIASGIILDRLEDVRNACKNENLEILSINTMGEWASVCCTLK